MGITMVLKGFRFGLLLQIAVGPVCVLVFQTSTARGFVLTEMGVLAVVIVDAAYILAAIWGMGTVLDRAEKAKVFIKFFGAGVLVIFGLSNVLELSGLSFIPSIRSNYVISNVFLKFMLLTLSSPLTILFWAGIFSAKLLGENMAKKDAYLFGCGAILSTAFFLTLIALMGSIIGTFISGTFISIQSAAVGLMLILFGFKTALRGSDSKN